MFFGSFFLRFLKGIKDVAMSSGRETRRIAKTLLLSITTQQENNAKK